MYHGASAIIRSARFWTLWTFITFESEAMPHSWVQYVIKGTTITLNSKTLLPRLSLLVGLSNQLSFLSLALHVAAISVVCCFQVSRLSRIKPKYCAWGDCGMVISRSSTLGRIFPLKVKLQCCDFLPFMDMFHLFVAYRSVRLDKVLRFSWFWYHRYHSTLPLRGKVVDTKH